MTYEMTDDNKVIFDFELHSELPAGTPICRDTLSDMLYFWPYSAPEYKILEEAYLVLARETHIL
jgi:hypothetical protein